MSTDNVHCPAFNQTIEGGGTMVPGMVSAMVPAMVPGRWLQPTDTAAKRKPELNGWENYWSREILDAHLLKLPSI